MKKNIVAVVMVAFGIMLAIAGGVAVISVTGVRKSIATSDWVNHTHAVMLGTDAIVSSLHAGEACLRNYLLTADIRDQAAYRIRFNEMVEHLEVAKALTRQEPIAGTRIRRIEELIGRRIDLAREVVKARELQDEDAARRKLQEDAGSTVLAEIQAEVQKLTGEQKELLRQRDKASYLQAQAIRWTVWSGLALNGLLLVFLGWMIRDDIAARRKAETALQDANAILEEKVRERTADLVMANGNLTRENLERQWSEQSMAHQLRYSDLIINSIEDHVFVISKALNINRVNPAVVHTTGHDLPDIVGSPLSKLLDIPEQQPDGDTTSQRRFIQAVSDGRELHDRRGNLLCKDGTTIPIRFNMVALRDANKTVGSVLTVRLQRGGQS